MIKLSSGRIMNQNTGNIQPENGNNAGFNHNSGDDLVMTAQDNRFSEIKIEDEIRGNTGIIFFCTYFAKIIIICNSR